MGSAAAYQNFCGEPGVDWMEGSGTLVFTLATR